VHFRVSIRLLDRGPMGFVWWQFNIGFDQRSSQRFGRIQSNLDSIRDFLEENPLPPRPLPEDRSTTTGLRSTSGWTNWGHKSG